MILISTNRQLALNRDTDWRLVLKQMPRQSPVDGSCQDVCRKLAGIVARHATLLACLGRWHAVDDDDAETDQRKGDGDADGAGRGDLAEQER